MASEAVLPVFDGHNDVLLRLWRSGPDDAVKRFLEGEGTGHIDLPRARKGGLAGGLCAIYVPGATMAKDANDDFIPPAQDEALAATMAMASLLFRIERQSEGAVKVCRSAASIRDCIERGVFAAVFHIEGAEMIGADLDALHVLHEAGLRSIGPVWSRPNIFAYGVPFRFPSLPDIGPGLSDHGKRLIKACNDLKIMVDLSHMNAEGFRDIAAISHAPLVASHSNVHALCQHSRNLTDWQLDAIRDTGGLAGINFGVLFLRQDGIKNPDTAISELVRHINYIVDRIGVEHVALGSDFDGTTIPQEMKDSAGLPLLIDALRDSGYDNVALTKICNGNWVRVLENTWGE